MENKVTVSMIAAMAENRVIGREKDLPWHLPEDLRRFKKTTLGHTVIMGRKTFESLGNKPLPRRQNIVLTRNPDYKPEGTIVVDSLKKAINIAIRNGDEEPFIIGGGNIYEQGLNIADRIYLTLIHATYEGDTFFPEINENKWKVVEKSFHDKDEKHSHPFTFITYQRK